jgi:GT2 family glycosyltransferase
MVVQPVTYVLVTVHNRKATTERFVDSLLAQTDQNFQLILVDDGSTDGTGDMVRARLSSATIITGDGSLWWAGGLQRGVDWLRGHHAADDSAVLIVNDDTELPTTFLEHGVAAVGSYPRSLLQAQLCDENEQVACTVGAHIDWARLNVTGASTIGEANCLSTRGLFLRVRDLVGVGGFRPRLLPHYLSDYEFTIRARRSGCTFITDPAVRLSHIASSRPTTGKRATIRYLLSRRSPDNPVIWTAFLLLTCPRRYLPLNVARVWMLFARSVGRALLGRRSSA